MVDVLRTYYVQALGAFQLISWVVAHPDDEAEDLVSETSASAALDLETPVSNQ